MLSRPILNLFLVSWLVLFLELTCIRWFPSHVVFLTFFTNIVLMACFVGMSVGCLAARNRTRYLRQTPTWLLIGVLLGLVIEANRDKLLPLIAIGDRKDPGQIFFGAEAGDSFNLPVRVPIEFVAGAFFLLIGAIMVGPGQEMGRAFNRVASRTQAYSANLLGSLAGIGSFAACSDLQLPPMVWLAAGSLGIGFLLIRSEESTEGGAEPPRNAIVPLILLACCVGLSSITSGFGTVHHRDIDWSPYYRVDFVVKDQMIETNLVGHQIIEPRDRVPVAPNANYGIPFLLQRDATGSGGQPVWKPFQKVLIIGAGSGNDVARALPWLGADAWIDAVEIDPVIQRLGKMHHPNRPYDDARVHVHLNDGRNFLRRAEPGTYDLVIFALVDSLVLQLGSGNMRLESYLFTEEALEDVKRALKPSGLCAIYNYFRHGWLAARINAELAQVFGIDPVVFVLTTQPKDSVKLTDTDGAVGFTAFLAGSKNVIEPLRTKFVENGNCYWLPGDRPPHPTGTIGHFGLKKPEPLPPPPPEAASINPHVIYYDWRPLRIAAVESLGRLPLATDDWPFLYVREPGIPLVTWRGMVVMAVLSLVLWWFYRPRSDATADVPAESGQLGLVIRSFFLGAGFMLVETKAVVQMALLFGSTWMVNTVVFAAILVMSLMGTLFVAKFTPKRLEIFYLGLFAAAGLGIAIPLDTFLGMDRSLQIAASCALVFAPIAFAGVIFATTFARSTQPDRVFGANVAGALLGGIAENASVFLGFQYLLFVAVGFYLLSAAFGNRTLVANPERRGV